MTQLTLIILAIILLMLVGAFISLYLYLHEPNLPDLDIHQIAGKQGELNIMVIFPHPDDEVLTVGGSLHKWSRQKNIKLHTISVTKGEKGDELVKLPPQELGELREAEYRSSMEALGATQVVVWNYPDADISQYTNPLKKNILNYIDQNNIDLIVTYEQLGLYGHPDHIELTRIVHEINQELGLPVLFTTISETTFAMSSLPKKITVDGKEIDLQAEQLSYQPPMYKQSVFNHLGAKYQSAQSYKSQNLGQGKPLWLLVGLTGYEYFTTEYDLVN